MTKPSRYRLVEGSCSFVLSFQQMAKSRVRGKKINLKVVKIKACKIKFLFWLHNILWNKRIWPISYSSLGLNTYEFERQAAWLYSTIKMKQMYFIQFYSGYFDIVTYCTQIGSGHRNCSLYRSYGLYFHSLEVMSYCQTTQKGGKRLFSHICDLKRLSNNNWSKWKAVIHYLFSQ